MLVGDRVRADTTLSQGAQQNAHRVDRATGRIARAQLRRHQGLRAVQRRRVLQWPRAEFSARRLPALGRPAQPYDWAARGYLVESSASGRRYIESQAARLWLCTARPTADRASQPVSV